MTLQTTTMEMPPFSNKSWMRLSACICTDWCIFPPFWIKGSKKWQCRQWLCHNSVVMSSTGELAYFPYHHYRRPDSFRDTLPQLCGGAWLVEPPGKLPRFGWSGSHGAVHLSLDSLLPKRPRWQTDSKIGDERNEVRPRLSVVRKVARRHRLRCH